MSDSFADLWNTSAPKPKPQNLTLAARLAEERKRQRHPVNTLQSTSSHKAQPDVSYAAWAGLDSLDSGSIKVKADDVDDDWGLRDFGSTAAVKSHQTLKSSALLHLLDNDNDDDDDEDILGMLSKPVEVVIAKKVLVFLL